MKPMFVASLVILFAFGLTGTAWASGDFMVYPAKGQSQEQQDRDQFECQRWATQQTGFDPLKTPTATSPPPPKEKETWGAGTGAIGGGLLGAGVGAIAGGGRGAAIGGLAGAGTGGLVGGMRRSDQRQREQQRREQWEREQVAQYSTQRNNFNRAFVVCLEGRGYTVR